MLQNSELHCGFFLFSETFEGPFYEVEDALRQASPPQLDVFEAANPQFLAEIARIRREKRFHQVTDLISVDSDEPKSSKFALNIEAFSVLRKSAQMEVKRPKGFFKKILNKLRN